MIEANIDINTNINKIDSKKLDCLIDLIKNFTIKITGIGDYNMAQVTTGGVSLEEINPNTLEVSKVPNLYLCGEILDVDGICGGYNLAFAFISGYIVGDNWKLAAFGFCITGIGFPLMGIIASGFAGTELDHFSDKVSPLFSRVFNTTIYQ